MNVFGLISTPQTFSFEDFECVLEDGNVKIISYRGDGNGVSAIAIPEEINGYKVTAISDNAFKNAEIGAIRVPSSIKFFGKNALKTVYSTTYIFCYPNYYAEEYAKKEGFIYKIIPEPSIDNFLYTVENGEATITDYLGYDDILNIPDTLGGYPVTSIAHWGLANKEPWQYGSFPENINPFTKEVYFPDTIKTFGFGVLAFYNSLEKVVLPQGITLLESYMFAANGCMKKFVIPNTVTKIGIATFQHSLLSEVVIPESVMEIDAYAFADCINLTSVIIPKSVEIIGQNAFEYTDYSGIGNPNQNPLLFTIYGYRGTEAERYALEYGHEFIALDGEQSIPGDANCDGEVSIADVVAVRLYCLDPEKYPFKYNGEANALVIAGQTTVQGNCAIAIQDFVVEKIKMLPIAG